MTFNLQSSCLNFLNVGITDLWLVICFALVLGIDLRALCIVGRYSETEPHTQPHPLVLSIFYKQG